MGIEFNRVYVNRVKYNSIECMGIEFNRVYVNIIQYNSIECIGNII